MLGDTQKVLRGFRDAGYQVVESAIEVEHDDADTSNGKKSHETGWRILTGDSERVGVVMATPTPRRVLGRTLCFGEPWFHTEPDAIESEQGWDAALVAERVLGQVGRGGVFHGGRVWHAASGNGIGRVLHANESSRS